MIDDYIDLIRKASAQLDPQATGVEPRLPALAGIRAVLFDIYGTLLISGSGDIGAADPTVRGGAFGAAIEAMGWTFSGDGSASASQLRGVIEGHHARAKASGVEFPEIDIVEVWRETCEGLRNHGDLDGVPTNPDFRRLAVEFEVRVNPVWSMPGLANCLDRLSQRGTVMGIISNAQFFTPLIFPAIVGRTVDELGFASNLRYYSYMHGLAKPGNELYQMAADGLHAIGVAPHEVLYVGNDMRNDIWPAADAGFRTALFAGDRRSLRLREQDANPDTLREANAIVTELHQILTLLDSRD